jgi:uncharacterized SAM-binding protein YcdF (DUF218 family)
MDGHIHKNWREARRYLSFCLVRSRCALRLLSIMAGIVFVLSFGMRTVDVKGILHEQLIVPHSLSEVQSRCLEPECGCIYVLGGSEGSLRERFKIAARLYHEKVAVKVMTLSRPGITAYDPVRGRNLTNDEWSRDQLIRLGIKSSDIEVIYAGEGFFGTLAEAKEVARLTLGRGYRQLILVTAEHHTRRAWLAFATNLAGQGIEVYAYMARDPGDLAMLAEEFVKLIVYRSFLL